MCSTAPAIFCCIARIVGWYPEDVSRFDSLLK